jgi:ribosomal protein S18 acetylase RimI-like enzyme
MKARGAETVLVSTGGTETGAIRLYESVGFEIVNQELTFTRHH